MDITAYGAGASGRLLKQGRGDAAFHAFVPHPLPPQLAFDLDLTNLLAEATGMVGELSGLARTLSNPYLFIRPFIRREAVASSRIEGTQAGLDELYAFEAEQAVLPGMSQEILGSDVREVLNYVVALNYGLERLREFPLSLRLIREVHERLMQRVRGEHGTPGEFRRSQNWIGPEGCTLSEATYVPPPVHEMNQALGSLEQWLHADHAPYHPLVRLAFIHYQFESIHPFVDGNGRIGRLLLSLLAVHWGLIPQPLLYLSPFLERHQQRYYDLLMAVTTRGEWRAWTEFFLQAVTEQARDAVSRTKRLQDLHAEWHLLLASHSRRSAGPLLLLERLFESPVLSIPQAADFLGITYPAAQQTVRRLVDLGIMRQLGEAKYNKLFVAAAILDVLRDQPGQP